MKATHWGPRIPLSQRNAFTLSQMRESLGEERAEIVRRLERRVRANAVVPVPDARKILPSLLLTEIGHTDDRRHERDVRERDLLAEQPRPAALRDLRVHALVGPAQPLHRSVHLLLRESTQSHQQHEFLAQRL